jgi:hypothetical protein
MGARGMYNDDLHAFRDNFRGSDRDKRYLDQLIAQDDARLAQIMRDQHEQGSGRIASEVDFALRVGPEGEARVDEILEDLRDGTIGPREAAKALAEIKADVNRLRETVTALPEAEERLWSEVNKTPSQAQRDLARRAPALFKGGRGLAQVPIHDD